MKDREELDARLPAMPWYIEQFIHYKLPDLSPSSLVEYMRDYETFLKWMMSEGLSAANSLKDVQLEELEVLKMESIDNYRMFLSTYKPERNNRTTISRKLSSPKYLSNERTNLRIRLPSWKASCCRKKKLRSF